MQNGAKKFLVITHDAIDNSGPYVKGVRGAGVYSVGNSFDQDGKSIGGFAIDLERAEVVVTRNGKNFLRKYEMIEKQNGQPKHKEFIFREKDGSPVFTEEEIFPSKKTTLNDPDAVFYTFMGEKKWAKLALKNFLTELQNKIDDDTHQELARGGSHLVPFYLANDKGQAYAEGDEPASEVFSQWAAIKAAISKIPNSTRKKLLIS